MTRAAKHATALATAHRGDSSRYRENTLPALRSAIQSGADLVEVDVRLTRDGQVVLLHDATLLRLWGVDRDIAGVDYDAVARLGSGDERIPLLSEALELFRGCTSRLLIDMDEEAPAATAHAVVQASGLGVSWCGALEGMRTIRSLDAGARIWLPWNRRTTPPADLLEELDPEYVNSEYFLLSQDMVDDIHAMGARVACWTVDDREAIRWLLQLGVDSITSNQLPQLQATLAEDPEQWQGAPAPADLGGAEKLEAIQVARDLARWAIDYTRSSQPGRVSAKAHPADLVTEVDVAIERHVREVIASRLPGHSLVGEETGGTAQPGVPCWYLDPLDGTTNYVNKIPWTAFSLALAVDRKPLVAVVADPWRGDIFEAVAGDGARRNGGPIRLAPRGPGPAQLAGTVVATELAGHLPWPGMLELLEKLGDRHSIMRIMGSATMTVTGVADGRAAGAIIGTFSPIDHLAGTLIVHEAGGVVLNRDGEHDPFPATGGVMVATPQIADELYDLWTQARDQAVG